MGKSSTVGSSPRNERGSTWNGRDGNKVDIGGGTTARIAVQGSHPDKNPIVVSFPGGIPQALVTADNHVVANATNERIDINDSSVDEIQVTAIPPKFTWHKLSLKSTLGRKIVGRDTNCIYTSISRGIGYDERSTKLCVGVYDRTSGVVRLYEAASKGTVYSLSQSVPHYSQQTSSSLMDPTASKLDDEMNDGTNGGERSNYRAVFEDFGSAKKRKVLKSQTANQVDIDHVLGASSQSGKDTVTQSAMMENVISGGLSMSESNRKALEESMRMAGGDASGTNSSSAVSAAHSEARKQWLPKYNELADKPNLVYSAKDIAGAMAWNRLLQDVDACLVNGVVDEEEIGQGKEQSLSADAILRSIDPRSWCDSVKEIIRKEIPMGSKNLRDRLACTLLLNWFLQFYIRNHARKSIKKPDKTKLYWFGMPMEIATRCIELFTSPTPDKDGKGGFCIISEVKKHKCLIHILLLYIMAHGPAMRVKNISPVARDLQINVNDASTRLRQAGCTIGKTGGSIGAILKVPLTFPSPKKRGGGGARR